MDRAEQGRQLVALLGKALIEIGELGLVLVYERPTGGVAVDAPCQAGRHPHCSKCPAYPNMNGRSRGAQQAA